MSHTTVDQFEVEPTPCFSGSYTSAVMSGTLGVGNGRMLIAEHNITSSLLTVVRNFAEQITYTNLVRDGKGLTLLGDSRFLPIFCPDETYFDSLTPSPVEIYPVSSSTNIAFWCKPITEESAPWSFGNPGCMQLGYPDVLMTSSIKHDIIGNTQWLFSYPFQGNYLSLERKRELPPLASYPAISLFKTGSELVGIEAGSGVFTNPLEFAIMYLYLSSSDGNIPLYPGANSAVGANIVLSVKGTINSAGGFQDTSYSAVSREISQILFFGFGDGFRGQPLFYRTLSTVSGAFDAVTQVSLHKSQGWEIRGFKYGLFNALQTTSKAVWRRGRFGQFRDMMEQRKNTKFFNMNPDTMNKLGLSDSAVIVKFVSGSASAVTASNPLTLNPTDSGIYDFEAKSGQPWYDESATF